MLLGHAVVCMQAAAVFEVSRHVCEPCGLLLAIHMTLSQETVDIMSPSLGHVTRSDLCIGYMGSLQAFLADSGAGIPFGTLMHREEERAMATTDTCQLGTDQRHFIVSFRRTTCRIAFPCTQRQR